LSYNKNKLNRINNKNKNRGFLIIMILSVNQRDK